MGETITTFPQHNVQGYLQQIRKLHHSCHAKHFFSITRPCDAMMQLLFWAKKGLKPEQTVARYIYYHYGG